MFFKSYVDVRGREKAHIVFQDKVRDIYGTITHARQGVKFSSNEPENVRSTFCFFSHHITPSTLELVNNSIWSDRRIQEQLALVVDKRLSTENMIKIVVENCVKYSPNTKRHYAVNEFVSVLAKDFSPTNREVFTEAGIYLQLSVHDYEAKLQADQSFDHKTGIGDLLNNTIITSLKSPSHIFYSPE